MLDAHSKLLHMLGCGRKGFVGIEIFIYGFNERHLYESLGFRMWNTVNVSAIS